MSTRAVQLGIFQSGFRDPSTDVALSGGSAEFYTADGTFTTPKNAYEDILKASSITSVTLNSFGQYPTGLYFDGGQVYDIRVKDSSGNTKYSFTNVKAPQSTVSVSTKTADYTATIDDDVILCDTTSGAITITLPAIATVQYSITVKNIGSAGNNVTVDGNGAELIDNNSTIALTDGEGQELYSDGTQWRGQGISGGTSGLLLERKIFSTSGTWTKPSGTSFVIVKVQAGGGGGGGCEGSATAGYLRFGGGGGAGGYSEHVISSGIGATETVTVGSGGSGGAAGANNGATGGDSSFGSHTTATGGGGGGAAGDAANELGAAGAGGEGTLYDGATFITITGGSGFYGWGYTDADSNTGTNYYRQCYGGEPGSLGGVKYGHTTNTEGYCFRGASRDGISTSSRGCGGMGAAAFVLASNKAGGNGGDGYVIVESYS